MKQGFSVVEVVLAAALFVIVSAGLVGIILQGLDNNRVAEEQSAASQFASEGIEEVRSIKQQGFANLVNSTGTGVTNASSVWTFSGSDNTFGKFTRVLKVEDVYRDGSGNIVASGGTLDPQSKKITSTVTWNVIGNRNNSVVLIDYLTNWKKRGILVFGNGGTSSDIMAYQIFDPDKDTWSTAASVADVDIGSTNRAARAVKLYSSPIRNEKILISRHFDGTNQYIYGQVYNGLTWGNVQLLSSFASDKFLDVQNFDGTYMQNGNFMVVFSDDTSIPKMRTWNGLAWSGSSSLTSLGAGNQTPIFITVRGRPGTNEVMAAFFIHSTKTTTQYWNGSSWSSITDHATTAPVNSQRLVDFAWSPSNPLIGGLVFSSGVNDRALHIRIWTADGAGSGTWSVIVDGANQGVGATRPQARTIVGRPGNNIFEICNDNSAAQILCYESNFTPIWSNPSNQTITTTTPAGNYRDFHLGFETVSGDPAIIVYSNSTATPQLKKFTAGTSTWDAGPTSIAISGTPATFQTFRTVPNPYSDDIMILMADNNLDVFSILWDGNNNSLYSTPSPRAFLIHGTNGSVINEYWYDFAWDY